ncbi:type IV pilus assembly protein PilO [Fibrobacter sp. UWB15]|uniref:type 4a pilus biogenesis protein PilO n=1 Tax=unclassified Fibrobacter TaxID=2634177 RepID=UPI000916DDB2|nr:MULTISPECIES: type 4a pilus biogenesis protein PilO [unclassified Fibrobacter]PWJ65058.1 type IV pilus assembly protein PilO [Fibrobacter sp. UWB6]SHG10230.1 type IV pilus assembly protein PilO [Fibrobacter sp. UWB8]SHK33611.1 type IV pilus assembly protein PilO [Fibrobacter sp. UWT2]SMG30523.1 type IV pilus assembly protein PilO [Fibrobacter sp. UWB15]
MGKIDLKDKRNVYAIIVCLLIMAAAHLVYNYVWDPFTYQRESLERDLQSAQAELDKINAKKHRVAELEMQLAQAEKDFEKLKEMFPEEEKVPLRLQDLYAVIRSSMVQIQKFNPEGRAEKEHYIENRYSIAVNSGYHMLGYLFAEIANFNYPTAITNLRLNRYSGIKAEVEKSETHGWTPITMSVTFNLTTYTSKKVGK